RSGGAARPAAGASQLQRQRGRGAPVQSPDRPGLLRQKATPPDQGLAAGAGFGLGAGSAGPTRTSGGQAAAQTLPFVDQAAKVLSRNIPPQPLPQSRLK